MAEPDVMISRRPGLRVKLAIPKETTKKKSAAETSRVYRQRLKLDKELYTAHRQYENARVKAYLSTLSEEKCQQYREKCKLRVRKYREKKKGEQAASPAVGTRTRDAIEKQQTKWRQYKSQQHATESQEDRDKRNAQRRKKYAERKKKSELCKMTSSPKPSNAEEDMSASASGYSNPDSLRKATNRAKKAFPKGREKQVDVITRMIKSATPRKRKLLRDRLIVSPNSKTRLNFTEATVTNLQESMKMKRNKQDLKKKRTMACALGLKIVKKYSIKQSRQVGIGYKMLQRLKSVTSSAELDVRKQRKDATVSDSLRKTIQTFYTRSDVSRSLPDARGVKRNRKGALIARKVMERSVTSAFELFHAENPDTKISRTTFAQLRPEEVLPSTSARKRDCLCEYCENVDLKLDAIRIFAATHKLQDVTFRDKYDMSRSTLCPKGETGEYRQVCLERNCVDCGTSALGIQLRPLLDTHAEVQVTYSKWENIAYKDGEVSKKRMTRRLKSVSASDMAAELIEEAEPFSKHLFDASWQARQYDNISKNVPDKHVVVCQDFAENFKCHFQDEVQGAHWAYEQVTLHASVASYPCPVSGCDLAVSEAVIFVSDDAKHDTHAVQHFNSVLMTHLQEQVESPIQKVVYFSDGAPAQYKNKTSFADLSLSEDEFGVSAERHFFGTRRGKGPCDREFGTLKKAIGQQINNRKANIDSAEDFFAFCRSNYTRPFVTSSSDQEHSHYRRSFFLVKKGDICRDRERVNALKPVPNTRQQHSIRMVQPFVVACRQRSCFCDACITGMDNCSKSDITGSWNLFHLKKGRRIDQQTVKNVAAADQPAQEQQQDQLPDEPAAEDTVGVAPSSPDPQTAPNTPDQIPSSSPESSPALPSTYPSLTLQVRDKELDDVTPMVAQSSHETSHQEDEHADQDGHINQTGHLRDTTSQSSVQYGSWVEVRFPTKYGSKCYRGLVINHDQEKEETEVRYLRSRGNYYTFPTTQDVSWERTETLVPLKAPSVNSRLQYFFS